MAITSPAASQAPDTPAETSSGLFQDFFKAESAAGLLLMAATLAALVWANSPWAPLYQAIWKTRLTLALGSLELSKPLLLWINDGLMAVFFFTVGLEIKREVLVGELSSARRAALPIAAAIGGMVAPAAIYLLINPSGPAASGWGIPMATDIAFALGILSLLGKRVPTCLKVFLTALAIADDLGAVLIIAVFYTSQIYWAFLLAAGVILALMIACNLLDVRQPLVYWVLGLLLWLAFLKSGMHATIGGVLAAMTIPASQRANPRDFLDSSRKLLDRFEAAGVEPGRSVLRDHHQHSLLHALKAARLKLEPPLQRLEHAHHPWVAYAIIPLFALANAGVSLGGGVLDTLAHPLALGVAAGLVAGKQIGVMLLAWLSIRLGWARPLAGASWRHIYGASCLCGIGFTMSIFIASLGLPEPSLLETAKIGIIAGSLVSGVLGWLVLAKAGEAPTT